MPSSTSLLRDRHFFPPLQGLPWEYEPNDLYYAPGSSSYRFHWCFVGEIFTMDHIIRPVFHVKDRDGKVATIGLYLDDPSLYNPKNFKVGNTICVKYAFQKVFADGRQGIRVEDGRCIQALPCSLQTLMDIGDIVERQGATCKVCDGPASQSCARCRVKYCSKDCQASDWKTGSHKRECPLIKIVQGWSAYDWGHFDEFRY